MIPTISKGRGYQRLGAVLLFCLVQGCATTMPPEPPLCVPLRPVLEPLSVSDQRTLWSANAEVFGVLARNDAKLKSHVRVLEATIVAHDAPLGSCE